MSRTVIKTKSQQGPAPAYYTEVDEVQSETPLERRERIALAMYDKVHQLVYVTFGTKAAASQAIATGHETLSAFIANSAVAMADDLIDALNKEPA